MSTCLVQSTDLVLFMNLFCKTSKVRIAEQSRGHKLTTIDFLSNIVNLCFNSIVNLNSIIKLLEKAAWLHDKDRLKKAKED